MNERIKELSKQAWAWAEKQDYTDPTQEFSDILEAKFAELIIQECIETVESVQPGYRDYRDQIEVVMRDACVDAVKEHFGVE